MIADKMNPAAAKPAAQPAAQAPKAAPAVRKPEEQQSDEPFYDIITETQADLAEADFKINKADLELVVKKYFNNLIECVFVNGQLRVPKVGVFWCKVNKPREGSAGINRDEAGNIIKVPWKSEARYSVQFRTFKDVRKHIDSLCEKYDEDPRKEYEESLKKAKAK